MNVRARARLHFHQAYETQLTLFMRLMRSQPGDRRGRSPLHHSVTRELRNSCAQNTFPHNWVKKLSYVVYDAAHMSQNVSFSIVLKNLHASLKNAISTNTVGYHRLENSNFSFLFVHAIILLKRSISIANRRSIQVRRISCPVR